MAEEEISDCSYFPLQSSMHLDDIFH